MQDGISREGSGHKLCPKWAKHKCMKEARGVSMVAQAGGQLQRDGRLLRREGKQLQREGRQLRREGISIHPLPGASRWPWQRSSWG